MAHVLVGLRVVRGPDWNRFNQDGGEGSVGSVVEIFAGEESRLASASFSGVAVADTACVAWDNGHTGTYRCGADGKHDLRVFDTATIGVRHKGSKCMECSAEDLDGILWRCKQCTTQQLCNACYHSGGHDLTHRFFCFPFNDTRRVLAAERNGQMLSVSGGAFYYPDHLPVLSCRGHLGIGEAGQGLAVGSLVQVPRLDADILAAMLHGRPDCLSRDIAQVIYEVGEVDYFEMETNDVFVHYAHLGKTLGLNPGLLEKVTRFSEGDLVRLIDDEMTIMLIDKFFRAWDDETHQLLGETGVVMAVTAHNHVIIEYPSTTLTMHPACVLRVDDVKTSNPALLLPADAGLVSREEAVESGHGQLENGRRDDAPVSPVAEATALSFPSLSSSSEGSSRYVTPDIEDDTGQRTADGARATGTAHSSGHSGQRTVTPSPQPKRRPPQYGKLACNFSNVPAGLPTSAPAMATTTNVPVTLEPAAAAAAAAASEVSSHRTGKPVASAPPADTFPAHLPGTTPEDIVLSSAGSAPTSTAASTLGTVDADQRHTSVPPHPGPPNNRPLIGDRGKTAEPPDRKSQAAAELFRDEKRDLAKDHNGFTYTNPADGVQFNIPPVIKEQKHATLPMDDHYPHSVPGHQSYKGKLDDSTLQPSVPTADVDIGDIIAGMFSTSATSSVSDGAVAMDTEDPVVVLAQLVATGNAADLRQHLEGSNKCVNEPVSTHAIHCVHVAACLGRDFSVQLLHEYGADIEVQLHDGRTAAHLAAMRNHVGVISVLHRLGADLEALDALKATPLHLAAHYDSLLVTRELVRLLADVNCQDEAGDTPLHKAVYRNHAQLAKYLLDVGADVALYNCRQHSALQFAASQGDDKMMEAFLDHAPELANGLVSDAYPPLHCAALHGNYGVADMLVRQPSVDVSAKARGQETALGLAVLGGHKACVELLVRHGAALGTENECGDTPLHVACAAAGRSTAGEDTAAAAACVDGVGEGGAAAAGAGGGDLIDGSSRAIDAIEMMLSYETPRQNKMAAIACFLARRGADLDYYNHECCTPLELCSDPEMAEIVRSFSPKEQPAHDEPVRREDFFLVSAAAAADLSAAQAAAAFGATEYASDFGPPFSEGPGLSPGASRLGRSPGAGDWSRTSVHDPATGAAIPVVARLPDGGAVTGLDDATTTRDHSNAGGSAACDGYFSSFAAEQAAGAEAGFAAEQASGAEAGGERDGNDDDDEECILCDAVASVVFMPCGHLQTCADCCIHVKKCAQCKSLVKRRIARNEGKEYIKTEEGGVLVIPM